MTTTQIQCPPDALVHIQQMLANLIPADIINDQLKKWGLQHKYKVEFGKLLELGDSTSVWLNKFVTENKKMLAMKEEVKKLAVIDDEVLISGPTGTGKEIIARALHGEHRDGRFIAINCAGLPEYLVESIIFGHEKGSFTGAISDKDGLMSVAAKGTFFLDEIAHLPLAAQPKFLRAIQEKTIVKVGGNKDIRITCRIICATSRDLEKMVKEDKFLIDLYARLSVFELDTIPLVQRPEDIPLILQSLDGGQEFIDAMNSSNHLFNAAATLDTSLNVRSLQRVVKRFKVLGKLPS